MIVIMISVENVNDLIHVTHHRHRDGYSLSPLLFLMVTHNKSKTIILIFAPSHHDLSPFITWKWNVLEHSHQMLWEPNNNNRYDHRDTLSPLLNIIIWWHDHRWCYYFSCKCSLHMIFISWIILTIITLSSSSLFSSTPVRFKVFFPFDTLSPPHPSSSSLHHITSIHVRKWFVQNYYVSWTGPSNIIIFFMKWERERETIMTIIIIMFISHISCQQQAGRIDTTSHLLLMRIQLWL